MPFIASGSYGCVFRPHLQCKKNVKRKSNTIGKIFFTKEDFEYERDVNEIISKIDPEHKFTVPYLGECETDNLNNNEDRVDQCIELDITGRTVNQLIYQYGGLSIMDYISSRQGNAKDFKSLFKGLLNILTGISKLDNNGYVHQDIKPDNVLLGKKINTKMYLIDFGLLDKKDHIFVNDNIEMLKYNYPYFPPEYKMYAYQNNFNKYYHEYTNNFYYGFIINGSKEYLIDKFNDIGITKNIFYDAYNDTIHNMDWNSYTSKTDLFSFGIVVLMLFIWSQMLKYDIAKGVTNEIKTYLFNILHPDPIKRYTLEEAIQYHKKIIKLL